MKKLIIIALTAFLAAGCGDKKVKKMEQTVGKLPNATNLCGQLKNAYLTVGKDSKDKTYRELANAKEFTAMYQLFTKVPRSNKQLHDIHSEILSMKPSPDVVKLQNAAFQRHCNAVIPYFFGRTLTQGSSKVKLDKSARVQVVKTLLNFISNETLYRPDLMSLATNANLMDTMVTSKFFQTTPQYMMELKGIRDKARVVQQQVVKNLTDSGLKDEKVNYEDLKKDQAKKVFDLVKFEHQQTLPLRQSMINLLRKMVTPAKQPASKGAAQTQAPAKKAAPKAKTGQNKQAPAAPSVAN